MNLDDIYNSDLESLLTVFFNIVEESDEFFIVKSQYRNSKHSSEKLEHDLSEKNNQLLSEFTKLDFVHEGIGVHKFYIKKNKNIDFIDFIKRIFSKIQQKRFDIEKDRFDELVILCAFIPRGSIDITMNYLTIDIFERFINEEYADMLLNLLISTNSIDQFNLNFRNLQKEYVENNKIRNTQLRINLKWIYDNYISEISNVNLFKYNILINQKILISQKSYIQKNNTFLGRMIFYKEKIINTEVSMDDLSKEELDRQINELRKELEFTNQEVEGTEHYRNTSIVSLASAFLPEECVCCKNDYKIEDRTFKRKESDRYYFELHHVISFGANKSGDILENLVKVCPACHRALTPGRANEDYQKKLIHNILFNSSVANKYVSNFVKDSNSIKHKIDYVFKSLK